ncbi:hypothetical protein [Mycobacteroides abscessus]|uniref:hypothetical protein n=1 Tax=Mycobacteroides abscessus TaxID=36809 RepID=UPI0011C44920|nr:hypothetical protein [Mycobacteroides abscessus]
MTMEERGWRMNWAEEREKRLRHLDGLPGKLHHERFEVLNRASRLFSSNGVELSNHIGRFVGTTEYSSNLPDEFEHEAVRFFHNYIASVATLRDMQRTTHRKLWPERIPEEDRRDEFDRRTVWEVEVYEAKVAELFGDDDIKFLFDLRNCALHHTVPMMAIGTRVSWEAGHYYEHANTVELKRSELDKFSSWGGPAKRFLRTQEKDVEFLPLLQKYSTRASEFFGWFWEQVYAKVRVEVEEYYRKRSEFGYWLAEENAKPDFEEHFGGNPIPGTLRRNRAPARSERCAFGTTGWGGISVNTSGVAVVGESDWDRLPAVGNTSRTPQEGG